MNLFHRHRPLNLCDLEPGQQAAPGLGVLGLALAICDGDRDAFDTLSRSMEADYAEIGAASVVTSLAMWIANDYTDAVNDDPCPDCGKPSMDALYDTAASFVDLVNSRWAPVRGPRHHLLETVSAALRDSVDGHVQAPAHRGGSRRRRIFGYTEAVILTARAASTFTLDYADCIEWDPRSLHRRGGNPVREHLEHARTIMLHIASEEAA